MYASRTQAAKRQRSASPRTTYARQPSCAVSSWYTRSPQSVFTEAARSSDERYRVQPPLAYFSLLFHSTSMYARPQAAKRQRPASPRTNSARQPSCAASSSSGQEERKESTNRDSLCIMCSDSVTSKYHPHLVTASMCRICVLDLCAGSVNNETACLWPKMKLHNAKPQYKGAAEVCESLLKMEPLKRPSAQDLLQSIVHVLPK